MWHEIWLLIVFITKKLIVFTLLCLCGYYIIKYRFKIVLFTGHIDSLEKYLGSGFTYTFWIFIGIGFFFFAFLNITGLQDDFIKWAFGWLFKF